MKTHEITLEPEQKHRKQKKKQKRVLLWIKSILIILLFSSAIVLLALSPFFNISGIKVSGSGHYKQEDIIDTAGIIQGSNGFKTMAECIGSTDNLIKFFKLRFAEIEEDLQKNYPYIKTAEVKYVLPGTVEIIITERKPIGLVPYMGANLIIDDEAHVLDVIHEPVDKSLPYVKGLNFESYEVGQTLTLKTSSEFETVVRLLKLIKECDESSETKIYNSIDYVDVVDIKRVFMMVDSRITVNLGDISVLSYDMLLYRINFFKQIFVKNLKKEDKGLIDFTMGDNPKYIPEK